MRRNVVLGIAFVALASLGIFYSATNRASEGSGAPFDVVPIARDDLVVSVTATGKLQPFRQVVLASNLQGIVQHVSFSVGDRIANGDVIAKVYSPRQEAETDALRIRRDVLDYAQKARESELPEIRQVVDNQKALFVKGLVSFSAYQEVKSKLLSAEIDLRTQEGDLQEVKRRLMSEEIIETNSVILSPIAGTVLAIDVAEGSPYDPFQNGGRIATIGDLTNMRVELLVSEADIARVLPGMRIELRLLNDESTTLSSVVERIRPLPRDVAGASMYIVEGTVQNGGGFLLPGMSVQAHIIITRLHGAKIVPLSAISQDDGGQTTVVKEENGILTRVSVQKVAATRTHAAIEGEVKEGERVLKNAQDGTPDHD